MVLARRVPVALVLALAAGACGSSTKPTTDERLNLTTPKAAGTPTPSPGAKEPVTRREAMVIRGWSSTLRHGHVARAARYFALPSVVANGSDPVSLRTRAQAEQFNRILTCGAKVVALARTDHHRVLATFRLTDRPGGDCGIGVGNLAYTAFRIQGGRITQWLRVPDPTEGAPTTPS